VGSTIVEPLLVDMLIRRGSVTLEVIQRHLERDGKPKRFNWHTILHWPGYLIIVRSLFVSNLDDIIIPRQFRRSVQLKLWSNP